MDQSQRCMHEESTRCMVKARICCTVVPHVYTDTILEKNKSADSDSSLRRLLEQHVCILYMCIVCYKT